MCSRAPIPTSVAPVNTHDFDTGDPLVLDHLGWTLPAGSYSLVEDCTAKGLTTFSSFGTLADLVDAGWGLALGPLEPGRVVPVGLPHRSDVFDMRVGVPFPGIGWDTVPMWGIGYQVDASFAVLDDSGAPATAADVAGDTLLEVCRRHRPGARRRPRSPVARSRRRPRRPGVA